ncbi:MAG: SET domain-containing protein [Hyphomonadaceae bacterium]|nr:SET domain-containing protein [Hyphomonadaceae bacterium]
MSKKTAPAAPRRRYVPGGFDLKVKRSSAGMGLFTNDPIPKGACVIEYVGRELAPGEEYTARSRYLFEISARKTIDGSPRWNTARYINHSCRPNCEPEIHRGRVFIFAKRAIKPGEELAYNYGPTYFKDFIEPHGCRCPKCTAKRAAAAT